MVRGLERQLLIQQQKADALEITSPIDGKVVTWKVNESIENRPVTTGTRLMEIADPTKQWELELEVPESKVGHVIRYLEEQRESDPNAELEVTFIRATHLNWEQKLHGRLTKIDSSAEPSGEEGNIVRMDVAFPQDELLKLIAADGGSIEGADPEQLIAALKANLKVGADVKAKIHCGRAAVGYVLFHDLWEFIQSRILFRL
jgi:hypothetical protein